MELTSSISKYNGIVDEGGHFGEDMLYIEGPNMGTSRFTVMVLEDATLGFLNIKEARAVVDSKNLVIRESKFGSVKANFDEIEPQQIIGEGTFGQVWLCSTAPNEPYALKVESKYELIQSGQAKAALREKNIVAAMKSPFVVDIAKTYQDHARIAFLFDFVHGGELHSVMHRGDWNGVPEESAKFYAAGILEALDYMHRRHVVHRNLKPENVLIDGKGYPKIIDFGFGACSMLKEVVYVVFFFCSYPLTFTFLSNVFFCL